jgi:hypothetical protein
MKYLPIDINTFRTMITGNYIYVDKTKYIYDLFSRGSRYYFLSRPRRFGKSLLISTLKELFLGNKDLFKDLWIYTSDYSWEQFPIVHLDFALIAHATPQELSSNLSWTLDTLAQDQGINTKEAPSAQAKLSTLVMNLAKKYAPHKVVVLIDEYDYPLLTHLHDLNKAKEIQIILKNFYGTLKGLDAHLRAIFITGVSKFAKTSIFSGINNLNDISLDAEAAQLLGYTHNELQTYFSNYIQEIALEKNQSPEAILSDMERWYDGYRFSEKSIKVYNPFSVLYFLKKKRLLNYWFESGTPSFLINLLKKQYEVLKDIPKVEISRSSLGTFEIENIPLIPLLFQTGYLTITDYDEETRRFSLGYPNLEVEESFTKYLIASLAQTSIITIDNAIISLKRALDTNDIKSFCSHLQTLFAQIPYTLHKESESYYHALFQFLMSLVSIESQSEILTNVGRIDLVIITAKYIYIFELKFNESPDVALQQIKDKHYYERYLNKGKDIILVGISFNHQKHALHIECKEEIFSKCRPLND